MTLQVAALHPTKHQSKKRSQSANRQVSAAARHHSEHHQSKWSSLSRLVLSAIDFAKNKLYNRGKV